MKLKKTIICVFLLLTLLLPSCGEEAEEEFVNSDFNGSINLFAYTPDSLSPLLTKHQTNAQVLSLCYESLMNLNNDLTVSYNVAENYSFNEDASVWVFDIKKDRVFSDGTPLNAHNVISSIDALRSCPENMYYPLMTYVKSYRALNDYQIELVLKIKGNTFLSYMNFPITKSKNEAIGSGAYAVESSGKDKIVLKATDPSRTNIETVNIIIYPNSNMKVNSYISNETDVISADFYELPQLSLSDRSTETKYISDNFTFLGFNTDSETAGDINVRKAIASLIDKEEIIQTLFVDHAVATNSPYRPGTIYSNLNPNDYKYDVKKAEEFLKKSEKSFSDISFSILVNDETLSKKQTAEFIAEKLNKAGMKVTVDAVDYETYLNRINEHNFTVFIAETKIPRDYDISFLFNTSGNSFNFVSENFTDALHGFTFAPTYDEKAKNCAEVQKILINNVPLISLYFKTNTLLTDSSVQGDFDPLHDQIYNGFTTWKIKN